MSTNPINPKMQKRETRNGRKLSSAASNVAQAKAKMDLEGKFSSIHHTCIEHGVAPETGEPTLYAIFPRKEGGSHIIWT